MGQIINVLTNRRLWLFLALAAAALAWNLHVTGAY